MCSILFSFLLLEGLCFFPIKEINTDYTDEGGKFETPISTKAFTLIWDHALHPYLGYVTDKDKVANIDRFGFDYNEPVFEKKE